MSPPPQTHTHTHTARLLKSACVCVCVLADIRWFSEEAMGSCFSCPEKESIPDDHQSKFKVSLPPPADRLILPWRHLGGDRKQEEPARPSFLLPRSLGSAPALLPGHKRG